MRRLRRAQLPGRARARAEVGHNIAHNPERGAVVVGEVVGHAREPGMHIGAAKLLGAHHLAGGGLHERRAAEEDRAGALDDHHLVAHGGHVGAACGAGAQHSRDLGNAVGRHLGLVVEDPPEVVAVGEDLVLHRQEGAAAVNQVDAGQVILLGDLLRPQVLLDGEGIVGAALHSGVVGDDNDLAAADGADAGNDAGTGHLVGVDGVSGEGAQLQEGGAVVQQQLHALAHQQLAALGVLAACVLATALGCCSHVLTQLGGEGLVVGDVGLELVALGADMALDAGHTTAPRARGRRRARRG